MIDGGWVWSTPSAGCVAINPFAQLTPEMIGWVAYDTDWSDTTMTQKVASAYASGGVFDLPGGEAQLVVGAEYREESNDIGVIPQYNPNDPRFDPTLGTVASPLVGDYNVAEVFSELHLPLLSGVRGAERLSLDLAGRLSDYNLSGRTTTSKIGLEWAPIDSVSLRGTWGKAIRAPNIGELYTADMVSNNTWLLDPCNAWMNLRDDRTEYTAANCATINPANAGTYWQLPDVVSTGNLELKPETAKTVTAGVVLRPTFVPNLTVSADYYRIDLRDAIAGWAPQTILNQCVDLPSMDNLFCDFVAREANGNIASVTVQKLNLAQSIARGVDINANWFHVLGDGSRISLDLNAGRVLERTDIADQDYPDEVLEHLGLFGTPKWKGSLRTGWSNEDISVFWTLRGFSKMRAGSNGTGTVYTEENTVRPWAGSTFYSDVYASYRVTPKVSLYAGLNNAFDRSPPRIPGAEAGGANFNQAIAGYQAGLYDVIGRTYYAGVRFSL